MWKLVKMLLIPFCLSWSVRILQIRHLFYRFVVNTSQLTKKTQLIGKLVTFNSWFLKPKNAYLRWHNEQWNKKIPNSHVYNQKIESAFHSPLSSHDVYNACVTKETKYKDHNVGQSHPHSNSLLKWGVGGGGLGCIY